MKSKTKEWNLPKDFTHDDYFKLLNQYYSELKHRDVLFWKQVYIYFYATLLVIIIPYIKPLGLTLPKNYSKRIFFIMGFLMTIAFVFIAIAYAYRLKCISDTYNDLLDLMPHSKGIQRKKLKQVIKHPVFERQMAMIIPMIMAVILISLNISLILVNYII